MTEPAEQGTHFWHMSFMTPNALGFAVQERNGHWTPATGMSRFDAMNELRRQIEAASPYLANSAMIAFDIQPNHL